jgi:hypothetical protein
MRSDEAKRASYGDKEASRSFACIRILLSVMITKAHSGQRQIEAIAARKVLDYSGV